ncbi:sortase A [Salinibacillus kushneri]|uniref:Sortase A n=1 Tax=Salinibacillus kushneri TaxID=237682 RepID=A0A1H9YVN3_9BACI|nr:class D sortase [Salinibacillus kushneri]SES73266.1 sortase A [Salinibacillus kushneri]
MKRIKLTIGILFILIGLSFIGYPLYYQWSQSQEIDELTSAIHAISTGEEFDNATVAPELKEEIEKGVLHLKIPTIDLHQPILSKTNKNTLNVALTQIKPNQTPGKGNFTIAGHRSLKDGRHFNRLPNVQKGETVILVDDNTKYHYKITKIFEVEPEETDVLTDVKEKQLITLVTCTATGRDRIIVQGELVETKEG